ncbi:GNAT family N-acetyltransferase [Streptomyces sp. NPDC087422]|uniref:GNAT family N-acetyltransferase n=1 Tax=Streptomyces sp. NPDC087422 TaxID=3365786 RepID=UPI0038283486
MTTAEAGALGDGLRIERARALDPGAAHALLAPLVRGGAPLGWLEPPGTDEVTALLDRVLTAVRAGDGSLRAAYLGEDLVGFGYWLRYTRPTHRPHADLERLAVDGAAHGHGIGRALTAALVADARRAGIEVLTLDARGDNTRAIGLYESLGFREYGRLPDFVAVGPRRYDKVFHMLDLRPGRHGGGAEDAAQGSRSVT